MADIPDEIESFLNVAPRLPTSRDDCFYYPSKRHWIPETHLRKLLKSEKQELENVNFIIQFAATGQSKCRSCGYAIEKKTIRLGYPISDPRGDYGVLTAWVHIKCARSIVSKAGASLNLPNILIDDNVDGPYQSNQTSAEYTLVNSTVEKQFKSTDVSCSAITTAVSSPPGQLWQTESSNLELSNYAYINSQPSTVPENQQHVIDEEVVKKELGKLDVDLNNRPSAICKKEIEKKEERQPVSSVAPLSQDGQKEINTIDSEVVTAKTELENLFPIVSSLFYGWDLLDENAKVLVTRYAAFPEMKSASTECSNVLQEIVKRVLTVRYKPPPQLLAPLLPFQEEGLAWMCNQELSPMRGGILADEMGMGKTIQMIALLLTRKFASGGVTPNTYPIATLLEQEVVSPILTVESDRVVTHSNSPKSNTADSSNLINSESIVSEPHISKMPCPPSTREDTLVSGHNSGKTPLNDNSTEIEPEGHGATLVIAPLAAVLQWKQEIERFSVAESLKVVLYHGACREALLRSIHKYDVVITTYSTVESDYRRVINTHKVVCKYCGRMYLPEKLKVHQRYFCGPDAGRTARQAKTQKKNKEAAKKAMKTLDIGKNDNSNEENFVPTLTNVFRSILKEANRENELENAGRVPWLRKRKTKEKNEVEENIEEKNAEKENEQLQDDSKCSNAVDQNCSNPIKTYSSSAVKVKKRKREIEDSAKPRNNKKTRPVSVDDIGVQANGISDEDFDSFCKLVEMGFEPQEAQVAINTTCGDIQLAIQILSTGKEEGLQSALDDLKDEEGEENNRKPAFVKLSQRSSTPCSTGKAGIEKTYRNSENERREAALHRSVELRRKIDISKTEISKKKLAELQQILRSIDESAFGTKQELVNRLTLLLFPEEIELQDISVEDVLTSLKQRTNSRVSNRTKEPSSAPRRSWTSLQHSSQESSSLSDDILQVKCKLETVPTRRPKQRKEEKLESGKSKATKKPLAVLKSTKSKSKTCKPSKLPNSPLHKRSRPLRRCRQLSNSTNIAETDVIHTVDNQKTLEDEIVCNSSDSDISLVSSAQSSSTLTDDPDLTPDTAMRPFKKSDRKKSKGKKMNGTDKIANAAPQKSITKKLASDAAAEEGSDAEYADPYATSEEDEGVDMTLSPLHAVTWKRIVLDEAHRIKGRTTSTAKAIYALQASKAKWCLTGTPLQNRVGELYSLVRFLRFDPFAFYFCGKKGCNCRSLHFRFVDNKYCVKCGHPRMSHFSFFNRKIVTPIQKYGYQGEGREAMRALKEDILDKILLRRTKLERAEDVNLPSLTVLIRKDQLIPAERDFYESLYKQTRTQFDTYVETGTLLHNYAHIFDLLSRLRQAVDHPYLIIYGNLAPVSLTLSEVVIPAPGRGNSEVCGLCQDDVDNLNNLVKSACKHVFHKECIQGYINSAPDQSELDNTAPLGCPVCYTSLTIDLSLLNSRQSKPRNSTQSESEDGNEDGSLIGDPGGETEQSNKLQSPLKTVGSGILSKIKTSEFKSSTKIEALMQELKSLEERDPESKSIIFSQYTSMLELIEWRLKKGGIHCVKLVGSLSLAARSNILYAFNSDPNLKVILISLKAGGEGLNLQIANNIFLMDPWWNPAAEMQAIQRAHRIGQKKAVRAVRFICENTIEEKILQLQEKKQLVFDGTVGASSTALAKLNAEDLCFLFRN